MPLFVRVECPRSCLRVGLGYAGERVVRKQVVYRLQQRGTTRRLIQPLPALLSGVGWLRFGVDGLSVLQEMFLSRTTANSAVTDMFFYHPITRSITLEAVSVGDGFYRVSFWAFFQLRVLVCDDSESR